LNTLCQATEFKELRFKPNERPLFRELNKSPFILYPIKETVLQTWHKVCLIIQICLGAVEIPNDKEFSPLKRQFALDKASIFECMRRLVKCFIDCRGADRDGVATKIGLELARSLAAGCWEGRSTQLIQVPGIGPVAMRKFVTHNIRTMTQLGDLHSGDIERILSRNPPFGTTIRDHVASFPKLALDAEIVQGKYVQTKAQNEGVVNVRAILRNMNPRGSVKWQGKFPSLSFMAETSGGKLAYFWHGTLRKLGKAEGFELTFSAKPEGTGEIFCHLSCDEIVGTIVSKRVCCAVPAQTKILEDWDGGLGRWYKPSFGSIPDKCTR